MKNIWKDTDTGEYKEWTGKEWIVINDPAVIARQEYLAGKSVCLYCDGDQIETDFVGTKIYQECFCLACERSWDNIYTLTDVVPT